MSEVSFKVRDRRGNGRFWVDNAVLDHFGAELGPYGLAVYMALCRFADYDYQNCWPSQGTVAERTGMGRQKVNIETGRLVELGLVGIRRLKGNRLVYFLLDVDKAIKGEPPEDLVADDDKVVVEGDKVVAQDDINKTQRTQPTEKYLQVDSETNQIWETALKDLRLQMTKATFETWLTGSKLLSRNGDVRIGIQGELAKDWVEHRLASIIQRTLAGLGVSGPLCFEVI